MNRHYPAISGEAADLQEVTATLDRDHSGVQSVSFGITVLEALVQAKGPMSLKEIGAVCGMAPSKAHRYLHSLVAGGLVAQQRRSGKYDLGPCSFHVGASAMRRLDVVSHLTDHLEELVEQLRMSAQVAIWTDEGPLAIRRQRPEHPIVSPEVACSVFPLLTSATGNVFLSHLPDRLTGPLVATEMQTEDESAKPSNVDVAQIIRKVREQGYAITKGPVTSHYVSIAAPVINWDDQICAVVTVIAHATAIENALSTTSAHLKAFCRRMSAADNQ